jgi:hypothetical protein
MTVSTESAISGKVSKSMSGIARQPIADPISADPALARPKTNLAEPVSKLVGRDVDLRKIASPSTAHRLLTLTGAGGIGKTRLARAAARHLLPQFADGVWIAELAPLSDPGLVPATIAEAVGPSSPAARFSRMAWPMTQMVNGIYNGSRFEDVWLDK